MKPPLLSILFATAALSCSAAATDPDDGAGADERPNLLFVFTDDQGAWAANYAGTPYAHTPALDRLRSEGASFTNSFVTTPVCSPSRATLMTGRYASELGISDWINHRLPEEQELGLDPATITWPELLAEAGYATGLVGKWHLGTAERFHPTRHGYQYFMGLLRGGCPPQNATLEEDGEERKFEGLTIDILTDRAIGFLEEHAAGPFALSVHYRAPHAAWLPVADEDWAPYAELDPALPEPDFPKLDVAKAKKNTREYLAAVSSIDRNVARLLNTLEQLELDENTVVVFTSDHGYNIGHHGLMYKGNAFWLTTEPPPERPWHVAAEEGAPKIARMRRPNLYDTSLRVPTLVRWPGVVEPGATVERTVSNLDWFPTILSLAGVEVPKEKVVRGRDIGPLLRGEEVEWDDTLYPEYDMHHGSDSWMRGYRTPEVKVIFDLRYDGRGELYKLSDDPDEQRNLFTAESVEIGRLRTEAWRRIVEHAREIGDPRLAEIEAR